MDIILLINQFHIIKKNDVYIVVLSDTQKLIDIFANTEELRNFVRRETKEFCYQACYVDKYHSKESKHSFKESKRCSNIQELNSFTDKEGVTNISLYKIDSFDLGEVFVVNCDESDVNTLFFDHNLALAYFNLETKKHL